MKHVREARFLVPGFVALLMLSTMAERLSAELATVSSAIPAPAIVIDFSQFSGSFTNTSGPVQIGGLVGEEIAWSSSDSISVIGNGNYGLLSNGSWNQGRSGYVGGFVGTTMRFTFNDGPVASVGGFVNYAPAGSCCLTIVALANDNTVLESIDVGVLAPISSPGGINEGGFRGIVRPRADIAAFEVTGRFAVLDNLTFSRTEATIEGLITMVKQALVNGMLTGAGNGNSANGRLKAWLNMLTAAQRLIESGDVGAACDQLQDAYLFVDGISRPPDFVKGEAVPALAAMIQAARRELGCL